MRNKKALVLLAICIPSQHLPFVLIFDVKTIALVTLFRPLSLLVVFLTVPTTCSLGSTLKTIGDAMNDVAGGPSPVLRHGPHAGSK